MTNGFRLGGPPLHLMCFCRQLYQLHQETTLKTTLNNLMLFIPQKRMTKDWTWQAISAYAEHFQVRRQKARKLSCFSVSPITWVYFNWFGACCLFEFCVCNCLMNSFSLYYLKWWLNFCFNFLSFPIFSHSLKKNQIFSCTLQIHESYLFLPDYSFLTISFFLILDESLV